MVQGGNTAIQVANMEKPRLKTAFVSSSLIAKANRCIAVIGGKEYEIEIEEQELSREEIERGVVPENSWFDFKEDHVSAEVGNSAAVELHTDSGGASECAAGQRRGKIRISRRGRRQD